MVKKIHRLRNRDTGRGDIEVFKVQVLTNLRHNRTFEVVASNKEYINFSITPAQLYLPREKHPN